MPTQRCNKRAKPEQSMPFPLVPPQRYGIPIIGWESLIMVARFSARVLGRSFIDIKCVDRIQPDLFAFTQDQPSRVSSIVTLVPLMRRVMTSLDSLDAERSSTAGASTK